MPIEYKTIKASLKELSNTLKIELNILMIITPCIRFGCDLSHVYKWRGLFVFMRNAMIANIKFSTLRYIIGGETN